MCSKMLRRQHFGELFRQTASDECKKIQELEPKTKIVERTQVPRKRRGGKTTKEEVQLSQEKEDFRDDTRAETHEKRVQYKDGWEKLQILKQKKEGKAQIVNGEQEIEIKMSSLKNFWE